MPQKKKLEDFDADELLAELEARQGQAKAKSAGPLAQYDTATVAKALRAAQKVIYGTDDRKDIFEVTDPQVLANADAVVALVDVRDLRDNGNGTSTLSTISLGDAQRLCPGETFREQPTASFCSGFLVASDIVATAGHCLDQNTLARARFVFGFRMLNQNDARVVISNDNIYSATALLARKLESTGTDYAVVKLDRPVQGRPITRLRRNGKVGDDESLYVLGHPSGLPLKYAPGAQVRGNADPSFFVANLDTYGGNSGSPVFNEQTGEVEGILVRGETDYVSAGNCRVSKVCPTTGCRGEDVTRVSEFLEFVPESAAPAAQGGLEGRVASLESVVDEIRGMVKDLRDSLRG